MFNSNGVSLADIAAVTGNNRNNDGMWGDGAWWIVILLIFGWGNNGWGGVCAVSVEMATAQATLIQLYKEVLTIRQLSAS